MDDRGYRSLSFWHDSHPGSLEPRPALDSERQVDVAIVGGGYTGLWTAYYLKTLEPGLRVAIAEAEIAVLAMVVVKAEAEAAVPLSWTRGLLHKAPFPASKQETGPFVCGNKGPRLEAELFIEFPYWV